MRDSKLDTELWFDGHDRSVREVLAAFTQVVKAGACDGGLAAFMAGGLRALSRADAWALGGDDVDLVLQYASGRPESSGDFVPVGGGPRERMNRPITVSVWGHELKLTPARYVQLVKLLVSADACRAGLECLIHSGLRGVLDWYAGWLVHNAWKHLTSAERRFIADVRPDVVVDNPKIHYAYRRRARARIDAGWHR